VDEPRGLETERRANPRFAVRQRLKYSLLEDGAITTFGTGVTIDFSSGGVAFTPQHHLKPGSLIELRIEWPWVLGDTCPILLVACGRIVRSAADMSACTIAEFEFLIHAAAHRTVQALSGDPLDGFRLPLTKYRRGLTSRHKASDNAPSRNAVFRDDG